MAYDDALFQLGMDLTRSSTAQKEDHGETAHVAHNDDRKDCFVERDGVRFAGSHLIIDLYGARRLDDMKHIERTLRRCVDVAGATLLQLNLHPTSPKGGVSGVAVLAESHISVHTWPEADYAAFDVFMSGDADPERIVPVLQAAFSARHVGIKSHRRGEEMTEKSWTASARKRGAREKAARLRKAA